MYYVNFKFQLDVDIMHIYTEDMSYNILRKKKIWELTRFPPKIFRGWNLFIFVHIEALNPYLISFLSANFLKYTVII